VALFYWPTLYAKQVCVQLLRTPTTWHCPHSPAVRLAAVRRAAINRSLAGRATAGNFAAVARAGTSDGQTDARQMHRPGLVKKSRFLRQIFTFWVFEGFYGFKVFKNYLV